MSRLALLLALLLAVPAAAQTAHVRVEAEAGEVWVDGDRAGRAGEWVEAEPGLRELTLVEDSQTWDPRRAETQVTLATGDSLVVRIALPVRLRVETLPIRATIVRQGPEGLDTLGLAPLTLDADAGESVVLVASLDGYESVRQSVEAGQARVTLVLPLLEDAVPEVALLPTERSTLGRTLIDMGIAAATLTAGAVAVRYKFRADALDDRYRTEGSAEFGVESVRQEVLSFDRTSTIALGAMQVGVGALALRFVLR